MSKPLTHRERAESAAKKIVAYRERLTTNGATGLVLSITYPAELVEAARGLVREIDNGPKHSGMTLVYLSKTRATLALYEEDR